MTNPKTHRHTGIDLHAIYINFSLANIWPDAMCVWTSQSARSTWIFIYTLYPTPRSPRKHQVVLYYTISWTSEQVRRFSSE